MAYTTGSTFNLKTGYNLPAFIYPANGMMSSTRTSGVVASSDPYTSNATSSFLTDISNTTVTAEQLAFISENEPLLLLSIQENSHVPLPTVTVVSDGVYSNPAQGPLTGGTILITGTGFTGTTAVTIGGTPATVFTVRNSTSITATTPSSVSPGTVSVNVTTPGGTSANNSFYTYM